MCDGFSRTPKLLKSALIQLSEPFLGPVPNVIFFQYNPETLSRTLNTWAPEEKDKAGSKLGTTQKAAPYDPQEFFSLALELDATDALEEPESHPVAMISGVADRLAALEKLIYPAGEGAGAVGKALGSLGFYKPKRGTVPVVLFFWGPGRIIPVRVTSFTVEEQAFSPLLYPIRAKVSLGLLALTPSAFGPAAKRKIPEKLAVAAYEFTRGQKDILAVANLANSVESVIGMITG
jgi:hypothetical protein